MSFFDTWAGGVIRSTDVAGITYHSPSGNLYLADSEINELGLFQGDNIFETTLTGDTVVREIASNNTEPTGIAYSEFDGFFYVTNDTGPRTLTRYDSNLDTPLQIISTKDDVASATDPEGVTVDPSTGLIYVSDGNGGGLQVLIYDNNLVYQNRFSLAGQMQDAEGITYHPPTNHLFIVDGGQDVIFEYTTSGEFVESYFFGDFSPEPTNPQGLTFGPTSDPNDDPNELSLYIADGMVDNFADGRVYEARLNALVNTAPTTTGIPNIAEELGATRSVIDLFAAFEDDEDPDASLTFEVRQNTNPTLVATAIDSSLGTLTLDYAPSVTGTAEITLRVSDTGTPSLFVETTFSVTLAVGNESPTTVGIPDVIQDEDVGDTIIDLFSAFDDPEEPDSALNYTIESNSNPGLFQDILIDPASGTLTLSYPQNVNGSSQLAIRAADNGSPSRFVETTFQVTIVEVNDTPELTAGTIGDLSVVTNSPSTSLQLESLQFGPGGSADEETQSLSFEVVEVPTLGTILLADDVTPVTPGSYSLAQIRGMRFLPAADTTGGPEPFRFTVTDNGLTAGLNDPKTLEVIIGVTVVEFVPEPIVIETRVLTGSNDAEEKPTGGIRLTSGDLDMTEDGDGPQIVGIRFPNLDIPANAVIQQASIQFQADETNTIATTLSLTAEASDHAALFQDINSDLSVRSQTSASVAWSPSSWFRGEAGPNQRTPDLSSLIQEVVDRTGWVSGNAIAFFVSGDGKRTAESFEGNPLAAPLLRVQFIDGNLPPTTTGIDDIDVGIDSTDSIIDLFAAFDDFEDSDSQLTYSVEQNTNPTLFDSVTIDPLAGTLTLDYSPTSIGTSELTIRVTDAGIPRLSVETSFTVTINPPNLRPITTGISDVEGLEGDTNFTVELLTSFSDPDEPSADLIYSVVGNSEPALFDSVSIDDVTDALTLDLADDANGAATITVRATDNGFPAEFVETSFVVSISESNDTPTRLTSELQNLEVIQNAPPTSLGLESVAFGPGGGTDEATQSLTITVTEVPSTLGEILLADETTAVQPGVYTQTQLQGMKFRPFAAVFGGPETFAFSVTDDGTTAGQPDPQTLDQSLQITVLEFIPDPIVVTSRVSASVDDAEEKATGGIRLTSSDLELTTDKGSPQTIGLRFADITVPANANIVSASIQFQVDEVNTVATSLSIRGEATDNALSFTSARENISSRLVTQAEVAWAPDPWLARRDAGDAQRTPDLATIIQEIVNRPGWISGNALGIVITGTGERTAESFDGVPTAAPLLRIEYLESPTSSPASSSLSDPPGLGSDSDPVDAVSVLIDAPLRIDPLDVNGDAQVTASDALIVINHLARRNSSRSETQSFAAFDVDRNGSISALDALIVINRLRKQSSTAQATARLAPIEAVDAVLSTADEDDDLADPALEASVE
ncbi:MAG: dockerin type I domain-containing protein [Planctomycetota bacterium]